jgi:hypothetical protein
MMMHKLLLISAALLGMAFSMHDEPDYSPKALKKALRDKTGLAEPTMQALAIPDSLRASMPARGRYYQITDTTNAVRYVYIGRVNSCRAEGCNAAHQATATAEGEYFDYFILFDTGMVVRSVEVYHYAASYGYEITAKRWLRQFIGYDGTLALQVGKNIDAIAGATISVKGITEDVEARQRLLKKMIALAS